MFPWENDDKKKDDRFAYDGNRTSKTQKRAESFAVAEAKVAGQPAPSFGRRATPPVNPSQAAVCATTPETLLFKSDLLMFVRVAGSV